MTSAVELQSLATQLRRDAIRMVTHAGSGHVGGAMGAAELFAVLYGGGILRHRPSEPDWSERDRVVLSNGHICASWYAVLARTGYLPLEELETHRRFGSRLQGHPARAKLPGLVETSSGPLGQGPSVANGLAMALRMNGSDARVYCILGDGELAEGQVWEAAMTAGHHRLGNTVYLILANDVQIDGRVSDVKTQEPIDRRFASFGWEAQRVHGHDVDALRAALGDDPEGDASREATGKPQCFVLEVEMARGVVAWEGLAKWHGTKPSPKEAAAALEEIGEALGYEDFPIVAGNNNGARP